MVAEISLNSEWSLSHSLGGEEWDSEGIVKGGVESFSPDQKGSLHSSF